MNKNFLKRIISFVLAAMMILTSLPINTFAETGAAASQGARDQKGKNYDIVPMGKDYINGLGVKVAKPGANEKAEDFIKNPDQPKIYTLRTDYKTQKGDKYEISYQPYIASVGEAASEDEKAKVSKTIDLPELSGYKKPQDNYVINYKTIVDAAKDGQVSGDANNGLKYSTEQEHKYKAKINTIKIKHVFQDLEDFSKYTNPDGSVGENGELITTQSGNTGSTMEVNPYEGKEAKGFVPEAPSITMQVPENAENFILEYRYNRAHYDVVFDTQGGTLVPTRTLYYEQVIPKLDKNSVPTKVGSNFQGWKPSVDLKTKGGKTYKANEIIKVGTGGASTDLDAELIMPASKVTFTAEWKDKENADYAIQFWAEKADHADDASLLEKYDYMGAKVYKNENTGKRPDLDNEPIKDLPFPDLDQARLQKIWNGEKFYRDQYPFLDKFFVYNKALTHDQNKDPENVNQVKKVESTGKTVYNIYYDRQVYELYFTKSNERPEKSFYPEIYKFDEKQVKAVKVGEPGNPYHFKARFNQLMTDWPNDAMQIKGFSSGNNSHGWSPNMYVPWWDYRDTPPYRLSADQFLDFPEYESKGGYTRKIDAGAGKTIEVKDFKTISFGIEEYHDSMPHHMDFWMDGFKPGETIIRYDLYRSKADTSSLSYGHKYTVVKGFTPYGFTGTDFKQYPTVKTTKVDEDGIYELNEERAEITPFPDKEYTDIFKFKHKVGELFLIRAFFNDADQYGDPDPDIEGAKGYEKNGYLRYKYTRNKYPLRFNYDPAKIKADNEFNSNNSLETFYELPLKALSPTVDTGDEYKKENPANLLDNPENLQKLGLTDLIFTDPDGKLKVKRPDGLSDQMVFKGWALDPAGTKLVWENKDEKMPNHALNLYAKWGEPDYKWKVTFDPDGGKLSPINEEKLTKDRKKIQEGDIGQEEVNIYAKKEANEGDKQIFTVIQRQKLVEPAKPTKKGYDFMGWEVIRYKKNYKGDYTNEQDTSYRETYKVPELYTFGNDVVSPVYLKAIWVPNQRVDVNVEHFFLKDDFSLDTSIRPNPKPDILENKRANYLVATTGDKQDEKYILARHEDLEEKLNGTYIDKAGNEHNLKDVYEEYNNRVGLNNSFFQTFRVEPEKIKNQETGQMEDNPKVVNNVFKFFYRPFRTRDYMINYIDERGKKEIEEFFKGLKLKDIGALMASEDYKKANDKEKEAILQEANISNKEKFEAKRADFKDLIKKYQVIEPESVSNGNRHYDARNYRRIPGWVLAENEKPQQQLFFDVNETTNEFLGINGTGADQIFFYYRDARVIEVPGDKEPPEGYVRVTFKIDEKDKGGVFKNRYKNPAEKQEGEENYKEFLTEEKTEIHYDVFKGLKFGKLPRPEELKDGDEKLADKYYITADDGKKFTKWDNEALLNKNTVIEEDHTFTAYFDWEGLSASGLVRTEAFKDPNGKWTNDFAPTIEELKKQLVWKEKDQVKDLPAETEIKFFDEKGNEITSDDQVYELLEEKKKADSDELVRTVNIKAKVKFKDKKDIQELDIPITVYKNVYEALTTGKKPLFLIEAEAKEAKDGGLKDITGDYIKVTVAPTGDMKNKDNKIYYVNKNAWVEIPEVSPDNSSFINWTADQVKQNDDGKANGVFDFRKRHKFTEDSVIIPRFSQTSELVVHESFKDAGGKWVNNFIATDLTEEKIKKAIEVKNGKAMALGADDKITIVDDAGKEYESDDALNADLYKKLQEKFDGIQPSRTETIKVRVTFANGEVQTVTVPIKVIKNIYEAKTKTEKPYYVPSNYVKVTLDPTTKAQDPQRTYFYVNPDAWVEIPGDDPVGVKEAFTRWTMKADSAAADVVGETYELNKRHKFKEDSTITAQYEEGKVKIVYVDEDGNEIDSSYHIDGEEYPKEKFGKLNAFVSESDLGDAPKFKAYVFDRRDVLKNEHYKDPTKPDDLDTVKYRYIKIIKTGKVNENMYFPVIFDANGGEFGTDPKNKKTVYVYFKGSKAAQKVTFAEIREELERVYGIPNMTGSEFLEWQDKAADGTKVADDYEIQFKGWVNGNHNPEIFYAKYSKASAKIVYLDLDGKPIDDTFKISGVEYPTEKAGNLDEAIASDVFTKDTAPKFIGYKFNRIELNPKDGKYALKDKATIKIYYEKDSDVIPAKDGSGNANKKPEGYVEVKFVPTDKAKDTTEKIFYVNPKKDVTIPIANPEAKATYKFKEWKMGADANGAVYTPSTATKFTEALTVITATYEATENIIPYDPSAADPMVRPEGYVRVSFAADEGLNLTEEKAYYVKANAGITLGNSELAKPRYIEETGYKFKEWDTADDTVIEATDIVVTAKATVLKDVDTVNHPGYKTVTFVADKNGEIRDTNDTKIEKKVYYVNPKKYVRLDAPKPVGNTGFDFVAWSSNKVQGDFSLANYINYTEDTIITAMFNQKDAVYPKIDGSTKPAGYVEVTFVINSTNGKFAENEVTTYYVDPSREVSLKAPNTVAGTGYMFGGWKLDLAKDETFDPTDKKIYKKDTTIYGSFKELDAIIPARNDDGTSNLQPTDYVAVLFIEGDHAKKVDGKTLYYVNPKAGKKLGEVTKPKITADTGWKHTGWDITDDTKITDYTFVVAQYEAFKDVIPALKDDGTPNNKPDGYVTVTFKAGDNGKLDGITEKVYYVNPNVYVKLEAPNTIPATGFVFGSWKSDGKVFSLDNYIKYEHDTTITANFNSKGDVIPKTKQDDSEKPDDFVTVNFVIEGEGGKIEDGEIITYFVKPDTAVTIHPPKTKANTGYEFVKWSPDTTVPTPYKDEVTTIKGSFKKLDDIIKSKESNGTINAKPEGYVTVQYLKGEHGVLDGQTTFYVNPNAKKTLADIKPTITVVPSPTWKFANWGKPDKTPIIGDIKVTAEYIQLPNIIKAGPKDTAPAGYVVIIFETDGRGTITGNALYEDPSNPAKNETEIVYFVNPKKDVRLADATATASQLVLPVPSTTPDDDTKYEFDQWRKDIDKITPIIRGRVHIAMFKPKEVKLIYDANGATEGTAPAEVKVDYGTSVRLAHQGDLEKTNAKFAGWEIGTKTYQAGDEITLDKNILTEDTVTAYAKWTTDDTIIKYDPNATDPTPRPDDTYARVTFAVDKGLELKEFKAYYVKKDAGILLGDEKLVKPKYDVEIGYKFDKWDKEDDLEITADVLVTAKATKLDTVVPEKDKNGNTNTKPTGYKEVVFVVKAEDMNKGSLEGVTTFYVNPTEYVTINPPTTKANTGFEFGAWDYDTTRPTVYDKDRTIEASFNGLKDIIPKTNPDGSENKIPADYKTVTFVIEGRGGKIADGEVTVYYVNPEKEVTVPQPKTLADTGYEFEKWDQDTATAKKYTQDTTVKGNFKKLDDIIPAIDPKTGKPNAKPDGYVKVTFEKGEHGKDIKGQSVYYVNPKAGIKLDNLDIAKPTVTAEIGYKFTKWDKNDDEEIKDNITVTAQFTELHDVIVKTADNDTQKPDGYIKVTFDTVDSRKGTIGSTIITKKVLFVNPNKAHVLRKYAPDVTPKTGYDFAGWDTPIDKKIQYSDGDTIKALYNIKGDVIPQEKTDGSDKPAGYVIVLFDKGDHGRGLDGKTVYYVNPNKEVTVPAPTANAKVGYEFTKWDKALKQTFKENTRITAQYDPLENIIPQEKTDESDKPYGYNKVTFVSDANGSLTGKTVYYVNPGEFVNLKDKADAITKKANLGYTEKGGTWTPAIENKKYTEDAVYTFNFEKLDDVIPKTKEDESEKPEGYVKVTLKPTDKATDETKADKVYFVNPLKKVTITNKPEGKKEKINEIEYTYTFTGWTVTRGTIASWTDENINGQFTQETEITAKYSTKVDIREVLPSPVPKKDAVTAKGDTPKPEDLIKNIPGSENNPLPEGTEINYTDDGKPDVNNPGKTTAKVEVKYPNGKTVIVEVPITVVDHVVPQIGGEDGKKPLVPDSYVKVTVDTTDKATPNTMFTKVFWVKPGVTVTIPGILAPTGKPETDTNGVTNTNNFKKWKLVGSNPEKFYDNEIKDTFKAKESIIVATYEQDKNVEPVGKDDQWIPQKSTPEAKDFIKNRYDDGNPNIKDNLPPGTKFDFVPGTEPVTETPGVNKKTKIKVTYPNGEVKYVDVTYNVTEDVVEQPDQNKKPDVPDNFVEVVVDTTDLAMVNSYYVKTYWVNPEKTVEIPASIPKDIREGYAFDYWQVDLGNENGTRYRRTIEDRFVRPTYIKACYYKIEVPKPGSDYVVTDVNVLPTEDEYRNKITPPKGKDIERVRIIKQPDVSKAGNRTHAEVEVVYTDGTSSIVTVPVYVQRPGETNTRIIYRDRIVEKEKIVEKIVKIKDNQRLKEVRFMQGFEGKFRPHDGLTRAEAAQILANALKQDGYNYNPAYPINYKDVKQKWYTEAIVITTQANVFKGYDDGYFRPEEKISRAEWIATLKRFQQLKDADGNRMGLKENHWAKREVEAAYEEGWLQIYTNGNAKFDANAPITREEVAAVSNRAFGRLVDKTYILRNDKSVINYKDINPSMWSYADILCASNSFIRDENFYMSHGIEYINSIVSSINGNIIFNVQLKNFEILQDKFQRYLR